MSASLSTMDLISARSCAARCGWATRHELRSRPSRLRSRRSMRRRWPGSLPRRERRGTGLASGRTRRSCAAVSSSSFDRRATGSWASARSRTVSGHAVRGELAGQPPVYLADDRVFAQVDIQRMLRRGWRARTPRGTGTGNKARRWPSGFASAARTGRRPDTAAQRVRVLSAVRLVLGVRGGAAR